MKKTHLLKTTGMLLAAALSLSAQTNGWQANGSVLLPVATAHDKMGLDSGLQLGMGYNFVTANGYTFRSGFALARFTGKGVTGVMADADTTILTAGGPIDPSTYQVAGSSVKHELTRFQLTEDLVIPVYGKFDFLMGLSISRYKIKVSGAAAGVYSPVSLDAARYYPDGNGGSLRVGDANGSPDVPGYKLGMRIGGEYAFTKQLKGQILFQQTELGRMTSIPSALPSVNPASLEFSISYQF
jgi:hypothetical protein